MFDLKSSIDKGETMKRLMKSLFCMILVLFSIDFSPVGALELTGTNYLNNGYIQFNGNYGASGDWTNLEITNIGEAVNVYGNLNNPYYFDGNVWRPLTLARKMEYSISEGGTLINVDDTYAVTGAFAIVSPATSNTPLTNLVIDASGISRTDLATTAGNVTYTGTMSSQGEIVVNGKNLQVKNTYTLLPGKSFVRVKTKITNLDPTQTATNIRYWVGTGDDWISTNDSNYKTRGNITDGAFVASTVPSQQSKAIRVDSQSFSDSILFYSTHPNANTSISSCCSFSNAVNTNPYNCVTNSFNDGSYALFVNLGSIVPNGFAEFDWYYAAGSAATILDVISDVALDSAGPSDVTGDSATIAYTSPTTTTGYYVVLPRGAAAPSADQIVDPTSYTSTPVLKSGSIAMEAGVETPFEVTDLSPGTDYDVYFVTRDSEGVTSSVALTRFSTVPDTIISLLSFDSIDLPLNQRTPDVAAIETDEYTASVSWSPADTTFKEGVTYSATITITPKKGYTLTGVAKDAFSVSGATTVTNDADSGVITATFPVVTYDHVTFHSNLGSAVDPLGVDAGALVTKPSDPTRLGYDFVGWYSDDVTFLEAWDFESDVMPLSNMDLYAKWTLSVYPIHYVLNGGVNFADPITSYTMDDESITLGIPTRSGYYFAGWYANEDLTTGGQVTAIASGSTGEVTLYAAWSAIPVQLDVESTLGLKVEGAAEGLGFTPEELALEAFAKVTMNLIETTNLDAAQQALITDYLAKNLTGDVKHVLFYDISLFKMVGNTATPITTTSSLVKITFIVPEAYRAHDLKIVRLHDGVVQFLETTYDSSTFELSFYSDQFSTYGLAYADPKLPDTGETNDGSGLWALVISSALLLISQKKRKAN